MTRRCRPYPQLVGADYWLPVEAFEVGWATAVGCNNLRCPDCGKAVSWTGPGGTVRRYWCACREHLETWTYWVGGESEDLYLYPQKLSWYCAGHPNLKLPVVLDGVTLDAETDWGAVVAAAMLKEPFHPPGIDLRQAWLVRLFHLLHRERAALSTAIAELLYATDPRLVLGALRFFTTERKAPGAERVTAMVTSRRDWLAETPHPSTPSVSLLDNAVLVLHARLLATGRAADRPALVLAKELALAGVGPDDTADMLLDHDPKWLWANARALVRANPEWADRIAYLATQQRASMRPRLLCDIAAVAPDAVRKAVTERIPEPERQRLLDLLHGGDAEADLDETE